MVQRIHQAGTVTEPGIVSRADWAIVAVLWIAYLINYTDRQSVFSIFPVLRRELGFSDVQLGLIGSLFMWVYSICGAFAGRLADRYRRERIIVLSAILWSLSILGTATSASVGAFLGWRVVIAVTESLYVPAALGLIAMRHPGRTRSRAISVHCTAPPCGLVAGGWFGGWTAEHVGWRWGFSFLAFIGLAYAVVLFLALRRSSPSGSSESPHKTAAWDFLRSRCYRAEILAYFMFQLLLWIIYAWLPNFIYEQYHLSLAESGLTATVYLQPSTIAGVLVGGALGDSLIKRVRYCRFLLGGTGLLLSCPFAYLMLAVHSLLLLKLFAVGFGISVGFLISNSWSAAFDVIDDRNYSFAASFLNLSSGFAAGAGVFLAGLWKANFVSLMGWAALVTAGTAVFMMWVAVRHFDHDRQRLGVNAAKFQVPG